MTRPVLLALVVSATVFGLSSTPIAAQEPTSMAELERLGLDEPLTTDDPPQVAKAGTRTLVPATLVVRQGDTPPGAPATVDSVDSPFTNGHGQPGFTGYAGEFFVWFDTGLVWLNSDSPPGTTLIPRPRPIVARDLPVSRTRRRTHQ